MIATIAAATQMQNNFGKYLNLVMKGQEVIVTKNGKEIGRLVPKTPLFLILVILLQVSSKTSIAWMISKQTDLCVSDIQQAARMQWNDYEDAIQSATAQRIHADFIITRNIKDFAKSKILAFTPAELLARI